MYLAISITMTMQLRRCFEVLSAATPWVSTDGFIELSSS